MVVALGVLNDGSFFCIMEMRTGRSLTDDLDDGIFGGEGVHMRVQNK